MFLIFVNQYHLTYALLSLFPMIVLHFPDIVEVNQCHSIVNILSKLQNLILDAKVSSKTNMPQSHKLDFLKCNRIAACVCVDTAPDERVDCQRCQEAGLSVRNENGLFLSRPAHTYSVFTNMFVHLS